MCLASSILAALYGGLLLVEDNGGVFTAVCLDVLCQYKVPMLYCLEL
jgi:hypothetical protein